MDSLTWDNLRMARRRRSADAPHPLTLTEGRASVKNSRGDCCVIANRLGGSQLSLINYRPAPVRRDANPDQGNAICKTTGRNVYSNDDRVHHTARRCAIRPGRSVPWSLRLSNSWRAPKHKRSFSCEWVSASGFNDSHFIDTAARNIHPAVGSCRHISHRSAARGNIRPREPIRFRIELDDGVRLHAGLAVPTHSG